MTTHELQLIDNSINGDRESFGQIVRLYQSLICSITYNSIGDIHVSEDIAQDTFVSAWKNLKTLQDKSKFKYWLCGIARNLTNDYIREKYRDLTYKSQPMDKMDGVPSIQVNPRQEAISKEEEKILWDTLKDIPEIYREPLILYYRENQSIKSVAESLDISEDAVKQRLSRGRNMLKEQVTAFVENTLQKSRPSETFAIGVLAALPALVPQAATSAILVTATKSSGTVGTALTLSSTAVIWGPILGVLGGIIGSIASIVNTKSVRERNFMTKFVLLMVILVSGYIGLVIYIIPRLSAYRIEVFAVTTTLYIAVLICLILWGNRRQKEIQIKDGTYQDVKLFQKVSRHLSKGTIYGSMAGGIFGSTAWMIPMSIIAKDWLTVFIIIITSIIIYLGSVTYCIHNPQRYYKILIWTVFYVFLLTAVVIFFRWETWMSYQYGKNLFILNYLPNRIEMILGLLTLYILLTFLFNHLDKKGSKMIQPKGSS